MSSSSEKPSGTVLCGANSYEEKYYFNREFDRLPQQIKDELQIMCVLFTEEAGGILTLEFLPDGQLIFRTQADEHDFYYDEIEAGLQIRKLQKEKQELLEELQLFYAVFFLNQKP